MIIRRIIDEHLFMPADRDERRPGARRQGHDRAGAGADDHRLGQQLVRHGGGADRLARRRRIQLEFKLRLRLRHRDAARRLERSTFDPGAEHGDLNVGDLGGVGRHLRLVFMRDEREQVAGIGIVGLNDLARAPPLHGPAERFEVQSALLLVTVVAGIATTAEDRRDLIGERHLRLRGRIGPPRARDGDGDHEQADGGGGGRFRAHGERTSKHWGGWWSAGKLDVLSGPSPSMVEQELTAIEQGPENIVQRPGLVGPLAHRGEELVKFVARWPAAQTADV